MILLRFLFVSFLMAHSIVTFTVYNDVPCVAPFEIISLETIILQKYGNEIQYQEFMPAHEVVYDSLPFVPESFRFMQPDHFTFDKTWVLTIPHGRACTVWGRVLIDEKYIIRTLEWPALRFSYQLNLLNEDKHYFTNVRKVSGRVAVLTCIAFGNYAHCLNDVLGRLAMLEIMGIDYDWLYVPYDGHSSCRPFMREILQVWGIDPSKIIEPLGEFTCIEADELIVPSFPVYMAPTPNCTFRANTDLFGVKIPVWLSNYYKEKFIPLASKASVNKDPFSKRIFISRKDSGVRILHNEDDVFALFEVHGFKKYIMTDLTFLQQVELFSNAEIVVGAHGAGMTNIMFCRPGTKIFEIFQERFDSAYAYLAQSLGLDYTPIKTVDFNVHDFWGGAHTVAPLHVFDNVIQSLNLQDL